MSKQELRLNYSRLRADLSSEALQAGSLAIATRVQQLPIAAYETFHIFLPIAAKGEINTRLIIEFLRSQGKTLVVPKVIDNRHLAHFLLEKNTVLGLNKWGIPEPVDGKRVAPEEIDVVFLPLLAFDDQGNRLGYGKGYYDTFLAECKPGVLKIGLSVFGPADSQIATEPHDIRLDYCITPEAVYSF